MVTLLGATGYIGEAFAATLRQRGHAFEAPSRSTLDYTRFEVLLGYLRAKQPAFVINAAGFTGKPNVDACETARADTLAGNTLLPLTLATACAVTETPWGHVSSGCIYSGAKILRQGQVTIEPDMTRPDLRRIVEEQPVLVQGFTESDPPNFSFRAPPCSFYSGTKALAEEALQGFGRTYIWRLRIPFDEADSPRNYLSKVQRYSKVYDNVNSISHRADFVRACVELWEKRAGFGTYNVTNPGFVTTRQVVDLVKARLRLDRAFEYWASDEEFYRTAAKTPRSNCVMDTTKLLAAGVPMRPVLDALEESLRSWKPSEP